MRPNKQRARSAKNHASILNAAAEVFADRGIDAPLNAVAKRAGVGQASLYRHFPNREALAFAVLESGVAELESLELGQGSLERVLRRVETQAGRLATVLGLIARNAADPRNRRLGERLRRVLEVRIDEGRTSGVVSSTFTVDDLLVCVMLMSGGVMSTIPRDRPDLARRGWELLGINLSPE